jgi:hypothetical protein
MEIIIKGHPSDRMIQRGIEYEDVENAILHGHIKRIGTENKLPIYQAVCSRFGKYVTVIFYRYQNCAYVETVRKSKRQEISLYRKRSRR